MQHFIIKAFANCLLHYLTICSYLFFFHWSRLKFSFPASGCYLLKWIVLLTQPPQSMQICFDFLSKQLPLNTRVHCQVSASPATDSELEDSWGTTFFSHYHLGFEWCDASLSVYFQTQWNVWFHHLNLIPFPDSSWMQHFFFWCDLGLLKKWNALPLFEELDLNSEMLVRIL